MNVKLIHMCIQESMFCLSISQLFLELPSPVCRNAGSSHVVQCCSDHLPTADEMGCCGPLFSPGEFGAGSVGAGLFLDCNTSFHSCFWSCFQPTGPDAEVSIKKGE